MFSHIISDYTSDTWIGASRNTSGGTFYWEDGTPISDHFVKWGPSQPDIPGEKCVGVRQEVTWVWHDFYCYRVFRSLCEFD
jgi:hypothetical protein